MNLYINGNNYHYALEQLIRVFMPDVHLQKIYESKNYEGEFIACESVEKEKNISVSISLYFNGFKKELKNTYGGENLYKAGELGACKMLYSLLTRIFNYTPQWGLQTGVRPTKIYFNLLRNNTPDKAVKYLEEELLISKEKTKLIKEVCDNEKDVIDSTNENEFSLYVSIPFCPSRCSYCSFISHSYDSIKKLIPDYVKLLCEEIKETAAITKSLNLRLRTVYIGGGTPTVLEANRLKEIFDTIKECFDLTYLSECTLEAGRPDTLSEEKLRTIKSSFVSRITINAQSFNDKILDLIGRKHTCEDIYKAYSTARKLGFDNINTDLIAGLEGESVESFCDSVKKAVELNAENITLHTLALKRSSFLITRDSKKGEIISDTSKMITLASEYLRENGYIPYYMYRQSKSIGNLENTGWAKPSRVCEYNIFMMEEVQNVFGVGAGAVTRLINHRTGKIERVYNFKYPFEYINYFENIKSRKKEASEILESFKNLDLIGNK